MKFSLTLFAVVMALAVWNGERILEENDRLYMIDLQLEILQYRNKLCYAGFSNNLEFEVTAQLAEGWQSKGAIATSHGQYQKAIEYYGAAIMEWQYLP